MAQPENPFGDIDKHLKAIQEDVEGSYKQASEQIGAVRSGVDRLQRALQMQGILTIFGAGLVFIALYIIYAHSRRLEDHEGEFLDKDRVAKIAKDVAIAQRRGRSYIASIAGDVVGEGLKTVPPRRSDEEIAKIAIANRIGEGAIRNIAISVAQTEVKKVPPRRSDAEIKTIADASARSAAEAAFKKVPPRRSDEEIRQIAVAHNPTDQDIERLALGVTRAEIKKIPARRSDAEIRQIAVTEDKRLPSPRSDAEIRTIAERAAREALAAAPRRSDAEIRRVASTLTRSPAEVQRLAVESQAFKDLARQLKALSLEVRKLQTANKELSDKLAAAPKAGNKRLADRAAVFALIARRAKGAALSLPTGADLEATDLSGLDLRKARLKKVRLVKADLKKTDLRDALLESVDLSGADLRGADLRVEGIRELKVKGAIYDDETRFDPFLLDLAALGAKKVP